VRFANVPGAGDGDLFRHAVPDRLAAGVLFLFPDNLPNRTILRFTARLRLGVITAGKAGSSRATVVAVRSEVACLGGVPEIVRHEQGDDQGNPLQIVHDSILLTLRSVI